MKRFEHIMIVSDMDGTFLGAGGALIPRNLEALDYFRAEGGLFTFASGRSPDYIRLSVPHPEEMINLPAVAINGTCLYDYHKQEFVECCFLDSELTLRLVRWVRKNFDDIVIRGVGDGSVWMTNPKEPYFSKEFAPIKILSPKILDTEDWRGVSPFKLAFRGDRERIPMLWERVEAEFGKELSITQSGHELLEVIPKGHSKGKAVLRLREKYGDRVSLLCTVGDYINDLEMHGVADLSVCPANACEEVKKVCKLCLCNHKEGVIADLIEYLDRQV